MFNRTDKQRRLSAFLSGAEVPFLSLPLLIEQLQFFVNVFKAVDTLLKIFVVILQ